MRRAAAIGLALVAACGKSADPTPTPTRTPTTESKVVTIELATDPGLSGLAVGDDGALWSVSERGASAYLIVLEGDKLAALARYPIVGIPAATDLESIEVLYDGRLAFGTEGKDDGPATVMIGTWIPDDQVSVAPAFDAGVALANHGVEGLCAIDGTLVFGLEGVVERDGGRFASLQVGQLGAAAPPIAHEVRLTSATGKLSALDCRPGRDGAIDVLAIERHFEVTRLIGFAVPREASTAPLTATVVRDLADLAAGRNFEGVARLADGRIALVTDNQWKTLDGPSQLLILPAPGAPAARPSPP